MSFLNMLIFSFVLFFYPIAVLGEDTCKISPYRTCQNPLELGFESLETVHDIKDNCPKFLNYMDCLGNYDETCGDNVQRKLFPDEGEFKSIREMIVDICDESSLLHTVVIESMDCLKFGLLNDYNNTCYGDMDELYAALSTSQILEGSGYEDGSYTSSEACFLQLYHVTCYIEYVATNCGTLAKDAVIEILHRAFLLRNSCHPEAAIEFAEDIGKIKGRDSLKNILRELVEQILKKKE